MEIKNVNFIRLWRFTSELSLANLFPYLQAININLPAVPAELFLINNDIDTALFSDRFDESRDETVGIGRVMLNKHFNNKTYTWD